MGIGFILIVHPEDEKTVQDMLVQLGEDPAIIGKVHPGEGVSYL